jgi:hypothetical protein
VRPQSRDRLDGAWDGRAGDVEDTVDVEEDARHRE